VRWRYARARTASTGTIAPAKRKAGKGRKVKKEYFSKQKI
jgi:hypothetical protein